jgi:hypothetical protein
VKLRPMKIDGDEFASVCLSGSVDGPMVIDVSMNALTLRQARALRNWLDEAIHHVKKYNGSRKKKDRLAGEGGT